MTEITGSRAPANKMRDELMIELGGRKYTLRFTFDAIARIEEQTGKSFLDLSSAIITAARSMQTSDCRGGVTIKDIAAMIVNGIQGGGGKSPGYEKVGRAIIEKGVIHYLVPLVSVCTIPLVGEDEDEAESEDTGEAGNGETVSDE